jgi:hypothetical protein
MKCISKSAHQQSRRAPGALAALRMVAALTLMNMLMEGAR